MAQTAPLPMRLEASPTGGTAALASREVLYALFKHRRLVAVIFVLVLASVAIGVALRPKVYRASTKVLVKIGAELQLTPTEGPSRVINIPLNTEAVNTEAEIVRSKEVVAKAAERLGLKPDRGTMDQLVAGLQTRLRVTPAPQSNVIRISFQGRDPERAAEVVNAITDAYVEHHAEVYRDKGLEEFYTTQRAILGQQLREAEAALKSYLEREGIVDVDQEIQIAEKQFHDADKMLRGHRAKLRGFGRKLQAVKANLEREPETVHMTTDYVPNPVVAVLQERLVKLEGDRDALLQRYLPGDRHVTDKEAQIAALKRRIAAEKARVVGRATVASNDVYRDLRRNYYSIDALLNELRARYGAMRKRARALANRLAALREKRFMVERLRQEVEDKRFTYELYGRKQEEARISEAMDAARMVNVSIVERARPPLHPQNGPVLPLLLALLAGAGLSASTAIGIEFMNRSLRFEEDVERYLEMPVLAVIPDLQAQPRDIV